MDKDLDSLLDFINDSSVTVKFYFTYY